MSSRKLFDLAVRDVDDDRDVLVGTRDEDIIVARADLRTPRCIGCYGAMMAETRVPEGRGRTLGKSTDGWADRMQKEFEDEGYLHCKTCGLEFLRVDSCPRLYLRPRSSSVVTPWGELETNHGWKERLCLVLCEKCRLTSQMRTFPLSSDVMSLLPSSDLVTKRFTVSITPIHQRLRAVVSSATHHPIATTLEGGSFGSFC